MAARYPVFANRQPSIASSRSMGSRASSPISGQSLPDSLYLERWDDEAEAEWQEMEDEMEPDSDAERILVPIEDPPLPQVGQRVPPLTLNATPIQSVITGDTALATLRESTIYKVFLSFMLLYPVLTPPLSDGLGCIWPKRG